MDECARIGLVGVSSRGLCLLNILTKLPGVQILAVCDADDGAAAKAQEAVIDQTGIMPEMHVGSDGWRALCDRDDLDAVVIATPWQSHTQIATAAMKAGKYVGVEVPACLTIEDCHALVETSEQTGMPCMMLENVNYLRTNLAVLRMVREGIFGEPIHAAAGYQHDCRFLSFTDDGKLTWRGERLASHNGNQYPTHAIGPVAWWININRGDRFVRLVSMSTKPRGLNEYAKSRFGPDHPLALRTYAQGDVNTTILETANGVTVTLYFDICSPRPYDPIYRLQGTKGICEISTGRIYIEGRSPADEWEPLDPYIRAYDHPLWTKLEKQALAAGGHSGCDYIVMHEFIEAVKTRQPTPQDVYDAATWSAIIPLSAESALKHGAVTEFPDFTRGKWKTNPPVMV